MSTNHCISKIASCTDSHKDKKLVQVPLEDVCTKREVLQSLQYSYASVNW